MIMFLLVGWLLSCTCVDSKSLNGVIITVMIIISLKGTIQDVAAVANPS